MYCAGIMLILLFSGYASAQITVTGRVVASDTEEPLPGVNVVIKGTTTGAVTNLDGMYTITVPDGDAVLTYSFVGYATQEITVGEQTTINVTLEEDVMALDEVVFIGYGTQRKGDVTSSIGSVKQDDFIKGSVKDLGQLIQGKVAGLTITTVSGNPTANSEVRLRGNTTLAGYGASENPLILIDGVPGDFNTVAPEDIESIDVLKDGSAAAIYGTRGTNGVIIITTTRSSARYSNRVEYSAYMNTQSITKKVEMSTAADVRQQIADGYRGPEDDLGYDTDWLKESTRTPISHVHNLTFRGGNQNTNYLANINYRDLQGIFLKSNNKVTHARLDINHTMFDGKLKFNLGAINRSIKYTTTGDGTSFNNYTYRMTKIYNPTAPVKRDDGTWYEEPGAFNYDNPVSRLEEADGTNSSLFQRISSTITAQPVNGLTLKGVLSYSKYDQTRGYSETKQHISTIRYGLNGFVSKGTTESVERTVDLTADYTKSIGGHRFTLLGGYSYWDRDRSEYWMTNIDFPTDQFGDNNIELGKGLKEGHPSTSIHSGRVVTNLIGFFSRANYSFNDKYLFMGSLRYEAASQLAGTDNPWGLFPAVSAGWRISNESFMENLPFIDDLKLRVGYGVTGTQPSDPFRGVATLEYSGVFYSDGVWKQSLAPGRNNNPNLRWEEKKETNIGLDYGAFGGRVYGSADYYIRKIDGLLFSYPVPVPPNLVSTTLANVGQMENKGVEVLLNVVPVRSSDFEWTASLSFSTNTNKLVTLSNELYELQSGYIDIGYTGEPIQTHTHRLEVGGKVGNFHGFKVVDISDDGRWIYEDPDGNLVDSEDFTRSDENKQILGNGLPKYYAGWNNTLRYKNLDLTVTMRGAFGFQILNFERMYLENTLSTQYNRMKSAYDKVYGKAILSTSEDLEFNSYYIEDGDYWKIDNIVLGYSFPLRNGKVFKGARIYASTLNTFTLTGYSGIDPEVQTDGLEPGNDYRDKYPTTRTYTIGFRVQF